MTMPTTQQALLAHLSAVRRLMGWTRERFDLDAADTVLVEQKAPELPGFPPVETVIGFWTAPDVRHEFKLFKPATEIEPADLPPSWMKDRLLVEMTLDCSCC